MKRIATLFALTALTGCGGGIATLPGDTRAAVVYTREGDIWKMERDGTRQTRLTSGRAHDFQPTLSPDRRWIVFTSDRDGVYRLYRMQSEGGPVERLTASDGFEADPALSPDGTQVAFISDRDANDDLYVLDLLTDRVRRLTATHDTAEQTPAFSPDGAQIAFAATPAGSANTDIFVVDADGSDRQRLTDHVGIDDSPAFAPEGDEIAFASDRDGDFEIYTIRRRDGRVARVTDNAVPDGFPAYTDDGRYLLFDSQRAGDTDIFRLDRATGQTIALTRSVDAETNPDTRSRRRGARLRDLRQHADLSSPGNPPKAVAPHLFVAAQR